MKNLAVAALAALLLAPAAAAKGPAVRVHGQWQIVVRSPSGKLVSRRAFHNAYVPSAVLAQVLAQTAFVRDWAVWLTRAGGGRTPCPGTECDLVPTDLPAFYDDPANGSFRVLTTSIAGNDLVLAGSFVAPNDGAINHVTTRLVVCPASASTGGTCILNYAQGETFTQHDLATPIVVAKGQQVLVKVTLSFTA